MTTDNDNKPKSEAPDSPQAIKLNIIGEVIPGKITALKMELSPEQAEHAMVAGIMYFMRLGAIAAPPMAAYDEDEWQNLVDKYSKMDPTGPIDPSEVN